MLAPDRTEEHGRLVAVHLALALHKCNGQVMKSRAESKSSLT